MRHHALLYSPMMKLVGELSVYLFGRAGTAIPARPFCRFLLSGIHLHSFWLKVDETIVTLIWAYAAGHNFAFF